MKIRFVIFLSFIFSFLHAQERIGVEFNKYLSDINNFNFDSLLLKKLDTLAVRPPECKEKYKSFESIHQSKKHITRELDFDVKQSIYTYLLPYETPDRYCGNYYQYTLHVLTKKDKAIGIIYFDEFSDEKTVNTYFNEDEMNTFVNKHNDFYKVNTTIDDLIEDILTGETYGYCMPEHIVDLRNEK